MLAPSLTQLHLAIATVCVVLMISLGFLARPQRSTVLWSSAFALAMAGAFGAVAADALDSPGIWLISMAIIFTIPVVIWSGLRAHRGARRTYAWLALVLFVVVASIFVLGVGTPGFHVLGRVAMLGAATFSALVIQELYRRPERGRGVTTPLVLLSGVWILLAVVGVIAGILDIQENYEMLTQTNSVGLCVYLVCSLVTLLFLARDGSPSRGSADATAFRAIGADRLRRAKAGGEHTWTLLDIRLDDTEDLQAATGETAFAEVSSRFHRAVRDAFPAEADVVAASPSQVIVLLARTQSSVRSCLARLDDQLASVDAEGPILLQLSASTGWADVDAVGYDIDDLIAAADAQAQTAVTAGGNRWLRA